MERNGRAKRPADPPTGLQANQSVTLPFLVPFVDLEAVANILVLQRIFQLLKEASLHLLFLLFLLLH